ncbi:MAG TPA: hypothetical protein VKE88_00190 [Candidatus Nanoarchaeia archaeon]|nr:hypothetical protein [Candidatus Nanoarchaeia archaeon]
MEGQYFRVYRKDEAQAEIRLANPLETKIDGVKQQTILSLEDAAKMLFSMKRNLPRKQMLAVSYTNMPVDLVIEFLKKYQEVAGNRVEEKILVHQ